MSVSNECCCMEDVLEEFSQHLKYSETWAEALLCMMLPV